MDEAKEKSQRQGRVLSTGDWKREKEKGGEERGARRAREKRGGKRREERTRRDERKEGDKKEEGEQEEGGWGGLRVKRGKTDSDTQV